MMALGQTSRIENGVRRVAAVLAVLACSVAVTGCSLLPSSDAPEPKVTVDPQVSDEALVSPETLTVALDTADAPRSMLDAQGNVSGYYADVARAIAQELGLNIAFVNGGAAAVDQGEADVAMGVSADDERDDIDAAGTVLEDASAVFTTGAAGQDGQTLTVDALHGATIGVQDSSAAQDALSKAGISAEFSTYASVNECLDALAAGEVEYVACDAAAGAYLARAYDGIVFSGSLDEVAAAGVGVDAANEELLASVADAFEALQEDGRLEAIHTMWFGSLPTSLSDTLIAGVTLTSAEEEQGEATDWDNGTTELAKQNGLDLSGINEL